MAIWAYRYSTQYSVLVLSTGCRRASRPPAHPGRIFCASFFLLGKLPDFFNCCDNNVYWPVWCKWRNNTVHSRYIGGLSRQIWIRNNSFLKNHKKSTRIRILYSNTRTVLSTYYMGIQYILSTSTYWVQVHGSTCKYSVLMSTRTYVLYVPVRRRLVASADARIISCEYRPQYTQYEYWVRVWATTSRSGDTYRYWVLAVCIQYRYYE